MLISAEIGRLEETRLIERLEETTEGSAVWHPHSFVRGFAPLRVTLFLTAVRVAVGTAVRIRAAAAAIAVAAAIRIRIAAIRV